jgi:hypothetical protein
MDKFVVFSFTVILTLTIGIIPTYFPANAQTANRFNWLQICRHPLVDAFIAEPCETLTSPDGYQLTEDGKRVLICLLGGSVAKLYNIPDEEIALLAPIAGCAGAGSLPKSDRQVTDEFEAYITGINGDKIIMSADVSNTGAHLVKTIQGYDNYHATFHFYAGKAPIGSSVNICVKNLVSNLQNCQSLTHTVNPELVNINCP